MIQFFRKKKKVIASLTDNKTFYRFRSKRATYRLRKEHEAQVEEQRRRDRFAQNKKWYMEMIKETLEFHKKSFVKRIPQPFEVGDRVMVNPASFPRHSGWFGKLNRVRYTFEELTENLTDATVFTISKVFVSDGHLLDALDPSYSRDPSIQEIDFNSPEFSTTHAIEAVDRKIRRILASPTDDGELFEWAFNVDWEKTGIKYNADQRKARKQDLLILQWSFPATSAIHENVDLIEALTEFHEAQVKYTLAKRKLEQAKNKIDDFRNSNR